MKPILCPICGSKNLDLQELIDTNNRMIGYDDEYQRVWDIYCKDCESSYELSIDNDVISAKELMNLPSEKE